MLYSVNSDLNLEIMLYYTVQYSMGCTIYMYGTLHGRYVTWYGVNVQRTIAHLCVLVHIFVEALLIAC